MIFRRPNKSWVALHHIALDWALCTCFRWHLLLTKGMHEIPRVCACWLYSWRLQNFKFIWNITDGGIHCFSRGDHWISRVEGIGPSGWRIVLSMLMALIMMMMVSSKLWSLWMVGMLTPRTHGGCCFSDLRGCSTFVFFGILFDLLVMHHHHLRVSGHRLPQTFHGYLYFACLVLNRVALFFCLILWKVELGCFIGNRDSWVVISKEGILDVSGTLAGTHFLQLGSRVQLILIQLRQSHCAEIFFYLLRAHLRTWHWILGIEVVCLREAIDRCLLPSDGFHRGTWLVWSPTLNMNRRSMISRICRGLLRDATSWRITLHSLFKLRTCANGWW